MLLINSLNLENYDKHMCIQVDVPDMVKHVMS
jgi:hypothetical protein